MYSYNTPPYSYYYNILYCCGICCVHIYRSPAVPRLPPLWLVVHGSTQQCIFVGTLVALPPQPGCDSWIKNKTVCTPTTLPLFVLLLYCCCICCVHIHRSSAVARPPLRLSVTHGNTQQQDQLLLIILSHTWLLCVWPILRSAVRSMIYRYRYVLPSCSPAVARSPPRSCWLHTAVSAQQYILIGIIKSSSTTRGVSWIPGIFFFCVLLQHAALLILVFWICILRTEHIS